MTWGGNLEYFLLKPSSSGFLGKEKVSIGVMRYSKIREIPRDNCYIFKPSHLTLQKAYTVLLFEKTFSLEYHAICH